MATALLSGDLLKHRAGRRLIRLAGARGCAAAGRQCLGTAAALSFEISSSATAPMLEETVPSGLATKSNAPSSRHSKVVAVPAG